MSDVTINGRRTNVRPVQLTIDDPMRAGVHSLWEQDLFVDYKIQVEDRQLHVHKVVIASMSDYFKAMLSGGLAESKGDTVIIEEVTASAVEILIKFIYTHHLDITPENVSDVLAGAMYLQIEAAITICSQFMVNNLDLDNWYDVLTLFRSYNLTNDIKRVNCYVIRNMREIGTMGNHVRLPYEDFMFLVENWQGIEIQLVQFILQWVRGERPTRYEYFDDLLCSLRLCLITPIEQHFLTDTKGHPETDSWNDIQKKALDYHKLPIHQRVLEDSEQSKVRSPPSFVTFSQQDSERGGYFYEAYNQNRFMIYQGLKIPNMFGQGFADSDDDSFYEQIEVNNFLVVAVVDDLRAVLAGERTEQWYIFDPRTMRWGKIANLAKNVHHPTLVHDGRHLYAISGRFYQSQDVSDKIEKYDFQTDTWSSFSTVAVQLKACTACVCNGGLYLSGGVGEVLNDGNRQSQMDRLDLTTGEWESKAPMLKCKSLHIMHAMKIHGEEGMLLIGEKDYGNRETDIEFYSPSNDEWTKCEFLFSAPPPVMLRQSLWVRGNSVFVSDNYTLSQSPSAKSHCAVVTFPEEGDGVSVEYVVEYGGRFLKSAIHTVLSMSSHILEILSPH